MQLEITDMGVIERWLGLEHRTLPTPAEFPAFMEHHFPHRVEHARAVATEGGGLRIAILFKNGRRFETEIKNSQKMDEFLVTCGMVYDL